jgi:uncharacterized membrane protein YsdA (DUF1294 family)
VFTDFYIKIAAYLILISILSFTICWFDKRKARRGKSRISENNLLLSVAIGGTLGFVLAMLIFRHKTSKPSFLAKLFFVIAVQVLAIGFYIVEVN